MAALALRVPYQSPATFLAFTFTVLLLNLGTDALSGKFLCPAAAVIV